MATGILRTRSTGWPATKSGAEGHRLRPAPCAGAARPKVETDREQGDGDEDHGSLRGAGGYGCRLRLSPRDPDDARSGPDGILGGVSRAQLGRGSPRSDSAPLRAAKKAPGVK